MLMLPFLYLDKIFRCSMVQRCILFYRLTENLCAIPHDSPSFLAEFFQCLLR